jgi:hypothetical protein
MIDISSKSEVLDTVFKLVESALSFASRQAISCLCLAPCFSYECDMKCVANDGGCKCC